MNRVMLIIGILEKFKPDPGESIPEHIANWDEIFFQLRKYFAEDGINVVIRKPFAPILEIMKQIIAVSAKKLEGIAFIAPDEENNGKEMIVIKTKNSDLGALLGFHLAFEVFFSHKTWPDQALFQKETLKINDEYIRLYKFILSGRNFNDLN
jgi:hypothetical protein